MKDNIQLIKNGPDFIYKNILLINKAHEFILFHTYIFEDDEITMPLINALVLASKRGVSVFVLFDAYGSSDFSSRGQAFLQDSNIKFKFFKPIILLKNIGRRLHQKVLLVDNKFVILGGINYSKKFIAPNGQHAWLDYSCLLEGEQVSQVLNKVLRIYIRHFTQDKCELIKIKKNYKCTSSGHQLQVKTIENDWVVYKQEITRSYLNAIKLAQNEIIIMATYFLPAKKLLRALKLASKRGVKIKLVFGAVSDHKIASTASDYFYEWYLSHNIEIYEWDKSIIHGKIALIDQNWVNIGSYNHNYISRYGNLEINFEVIDNDFAKAVEAEFSKIIKESIQITSSNLAKTRGNRFKVFMAYVLLNVIVFVSLITIFTRRKNKEGKL